MGVLVEVGVLVGVRVELGEALAVLDTVGVEDGTQVMAKVNEPGRSNESTIIR